MKIIELAKQLSISRQVLHRHIKRGCPIDSLEAAIAWRKRNLDLTQTKGWRIDGNSGVKCKPVQVNKNTSEIDESILNQFDREAENKIISKVLTDMVPELWFSQIGRLGRALLDNGVNVPAEKLIEIQNALFMMWMIEVDDYLQAESRYKIPFSLAIHPGDKAYPSLIQSLNKILSK
ncbi:MAG: helix-turn-helix domain-containing protein [Nitrosomonas sp.]|uniref:hypothetical protein n=1 Tax=Nitrosomonas sp. TaxID=42353 RepID=UPI001D9F0CE0|nr:hypothetical protein [Nitrosomonas sp.]MBX9895592.1 helix-turn-helix domain-containing protein [Nitrosomonas sp.]